jgi:hypothetical protein
MLLTTALVAAVLTAISNQLVAAEIPKVGILNRAPTVRQDNPDGLELG